MTNDFLDPFCFVEPMACSEAHDLFETLKRLGAIEESQVLEVIHYGTTYSASGDAIISDSETHYLVLRPSEWGEL